MSDNLFTAEDGSITHDHPCDMKDDEKGAGIAGTCTWERTMQAEFDARAVTLPPGWSRKFEAHWSCAAAVLYRHRGSWERDDEERVVHYDDGEVCLCGIEFRLGESMQPDDLDALVAVMKADYAWLRAQAVKDKVCRCDLGVGPKEHCPAHVGA